jgi:hypothetical protein
MTHFCPFYEIIKIKERPKITDKYGRSGWIWSNTCPPPGRRESKREGKKNDCLRRKYSQTASKLAGRTGRGIPGLRR